MSISIEQVIDQIPGWAGQSLTIAPLSGGLTNTIYRVDVDGVPFVVRIPGANTELLAVDRANEYHNTHAAATAGICPRVAHFLPDENVMVLEFLHGETMTISGLQRPNMPTRMAQSLKQLHAGPRFLLLGAEVAITVRFTGNADRIPFGVQEHRHPDPAIIGCLYEAPDVLRVRHGPFPTPYVHEPRAAVHPILHLSLGGLGVVFIAKAGRAAATGLHLAFVVVVFDDVNPADGRGAEPTPKFAGRVDGLRVQHLAAGPIAAGSIFD